MSKVFDEIVSKNIDELAEWLDKYGYFDGSPWTEWFDKNYCSKCESVITGEQDEYWSNEFYWCELNGKCRFFVEMDNIPDNKFVIKLWLGSDDEYEDRREEVCNELY